MKILVMSDSHSTIRFMRDCIESVRPDAMIHLGDYYDDGETIAELYPAIPIYQVPGNCDRYRCINSASEILILPILGVPLYMTHGHRHNVKMYLSALLKDARTSRCAAVLFGHTHEPLCFREPDGLWVLNPGSCGYYGGSVGLIDIQDGKIRSCRILKQDDLEV